MCLIGKTRTPKLAYLGSIMVRRYTYQDVPLDKAVLFLEVKAQLLHVVLLNLILMGCSSGIA
jgi:hypothetical protein